VVVIATYDSFGCSEAVWIPISSSRTKDSKDKPIVSKVDSVSGNSALDTLTPGFLSMKSKMGFVAVICCAMPWLTFYENQYVRFGSDLCLDAHTEYDSDVAIPVYTVRKTTSD
jgi:hypothetical protein